METARQRARFDIRPAGTADLTPPPAIALKPAIGLKPAIALKKVLAVAQPLAEVDGMPFVLTSAELWSNRVDLFLAGLPTVESERHIRQYEAELNKWPTEVPPPPTRPTYQVAG